MRHHATAEGNIPFTAEEELEADAREAQYAAEAPAATHKASIINQIAAIEAQVTNRRIREAVRGSGKVWLDSIDDQIAALRTQLK